MCRALIENPITLMLQSECLLLRPEVRCAGPLKIQTPTCCISEDCIPAKDAKAEVGEVQRTCLITCSKRHLMLCEPFKTLPPVGIWRGIVHVAWLRMLCFLPLS